MKNQNGFTLVELAIVLAIIGLLIGGILRGQEMLANARVDAIIEQTKAYEGALRTFEEEYNNIPGDMAVASSKLPGCQPGNTNHCQNGNGDGVVGVLQAGNNNEANEVWNNIDPSITSENAQFWKQLALAHLITGVDPSAAVPEWGHSNPTASIGGGFFVRYSNYVIDATEAATSAHFFVLRNEISGNWDCGNGGAGACSISPLRAAQIDRKADDGVATTGDILAVSAGWMNGCGTANLGPNGPNGYAETMGNTACDIMFMVK